MYLGACVIVCSVDTCSPVYVVNAFLVSFEFVRVASSSCGVSGVHLVIQQLQAMAQGVAYSL